MVRACRCRLWPSSWRGGRGNRRGCPETATDRTTRCIR
jgi:hypothetical protein